jgi:hypothetical protein
LGLVVCFFGLAIHVCAQQLASLTVSVNDPAGSAVTQARVTVASRETGAKRSELSAASGVAVIPGLAPGNYELTVEAHHFGTYRALLTLTVGQVATVPVVLGIATLKEQIDLQETVQAVDTQESEVSRRIGYVSSGLPPAPIPPTMDAISARW